MSAKYERIKKADLALPAPLRWLTRAFSSITLAVIILTIICIYAVFATLPITFMLKAVLWSAMAASTTGVALIGSVYLFRRTRLPIAAKIVISLIALGVSSFIGFLAGASAFNWMRYEPWYAELRGTIIYKTRFFEMTEIEFYSWWPFQMLLIIFVINMIWATIRRIDFNLPKLGVLTVHAGIVILSVGSMLYGVLKVEGDVFLLRPDLGGSWETTFYDVHAPALFVSRRTSTGQREMMIPLEGSRKIPRYNDYEVGELNIPIHESPGFTELFGNELQVSIPGFHPYADLTPKIFEADAGSENNSSVSDEKLGPSLYVQQGNSTQPLPRFDPLLLSANIPARRKATTDAFDVEFLNNPSEQRVRDLLTPTSTAHGLIVRIPALQFQTIIQLTEARLNTDIPLADTGYSINVQNVDRYSIGFVTPGYRGANDTQATVRFFGNNDVVGEKDFTRVTMHRYPERSQDFVQDANAPSATVTNSDAPFAGLSMGQRQAPDPEIEIVYLDNTKFQFHIMIGGPDILDPEGKPMNLPDDQLKLIMRIPGFRPVFGPMIGNSFPLAAGQNAPWLHVLEKYQNPVEDIAPVIVPKIERDPSEEGTFVHSLLPVRLSIDTETGPWQRTVWLRHMRYPEMPQGEYRPEIVDVPGIGEVTVAFSRKRHPLPFAIRLDAFEMTPYPGSDIPLDYRSDITIRDINADRLITGPEVSYATYLNNPAIHRASGSSLKFGKLKLSQNGWDAPQPDDPDAENVDANGLFTNQQRFTILGVANNVGIRIIAFGAVLIGIGIPWAFYIKPLLVQREKRKLAEKYGKKKPKPETETTVKPESPKEPALAG